MAIKLKDMQAGLRDKIQRKLKTRMQTDEVARIALTTAAQLRYNERLTPSEAKRVLLKAMTLLR